MAQESEAASPVVQTAMLRTTVVGSADATVGAPVCVHRLAKPAVAPTAPAAATPAVAPAAVAWSAHEAIPATAPVALAAPQSVPAMAPPSPVAAPAPTAAVAPAAPAAPAATPAAPAVAPVAPAAPADKEKSKNKSTYVYRMTGPDGDDVVVINGKVRAMTPEEKEQIERAMEQFKNGDFARHMVDLQREMADLKIKETFDSPEFREKMEAAQRELAQSALVNNAELHARIQAMVKNFDKQNLYVEHCKDGVVKDKNKDKEKQKQPGSPQNQ
jgi:hypothetical protein